MDKRTKEGIEDSRFLRACRREPVDATPIWLMRQAGRYMPEYRALKEKYSILEMVKKPDVATEITLQPVRAFRVDAAIIFADILTLLEPMGLKLEFVKGRGPLIHNPLRTLSDVNALIVRPPAESLDFTLKAIQLVKRELDGKLPLIGFSGAPFTLACYAIEGGASRDYLLTKRLMHEGSAAWHRLMEKMAWSVGAYLRAQAEAGADALQLFDSWAGALSPQDYREHVLPYSQRAIQIATEAKPVPVIHFATGTGGLLSLMRAAGGSVVGVDWRIDLMEAWNKIGHDFAIQGNLDPAILLSSIPEIRKQAKLILDRVAGRPGHIFNLGHGVLEPTPVENVAALVDFVHEYTSKKS